MISAARKVLGAGGLPLYGQGPHWVARDGQANNEEYYGCCVCANNDILATGFIILGTDSPAITLTRYGPDGVIKWRYVFQSSDVDDAKAVAEDSNGNIYVSGNTPKSSGPSEVLLMKLNSSGTLLWSRILDAGQAKGIAVDSNDDIIVSGTLAVFVYGGNDIFTAKFNSSGTCLWKRAVGQDVFEEGFTCAVDSNDNIYVSANCMPSGVFKDHAATIKYAPDGTFQWLKAVGDGSLAYSGRSVAVDRAGNNYTCGYENTAAILIKRNPSGTILWSKKTVGSGLHSANCVTTDKFDNVYLGAYHDPNSQFKAQPNVLKFNSSGTLLWSRGLKSTSDGFMTLNGITVDHNSNVILVGGTNESSSGGNDSYMVKLDPDGNGAGTYLGVLYGPSTLTVSNATFAEVADTFLKSNQPTTTSTPSFSVSALTSTTAKANMNT